MRRSLWFAFRFALAGILPFLLIEAGLRLAGWAPREDGYRLDFGGHRPIFELQGDEWRPTPEMARYFRGQPFPATRDGRSLLLFSAGDSIVWGYRGNEFEGPLASFSDVLQQLLRERVPGSDHRVINVGARTFASERVVGVVGEVVERKPDVVIAYFGSSEYLEHRLASRAPGWLTDSRVVQGLALLFRRREASGGLSLDGLRVRDPSLKTSFLAPESLVTDASRSALFDETSRHVEAIVQACRSHGVHLVLTTVPSHLRFPPFATRFANPSRERAGLDLIRQAGQLIAEGAGARAQSLLLPAVAASPEAAGLHYRLAQAQELLGDTRAARDSYLAARDTDAFPLRATTAFNELIRKTAKRNPDVILVDFEQLFSERVPDGIPDDRLFLDDSHPTEKTHRWMAEELYRSLSAAGWLQPRT